MNKLTEEEISFGMFPRLYISAIISKEKCDIIVQAIQNNLKNENPKLEHIEFRKFEDLGNSKKSNTGNSKGSGTEILKKSDSDGNAGVIEIQVQELTLDYMRAKDFNFQTKEIFDFSNKLESVIREINSNNENGEVSLDDQNPPYLVTIANPTSKNEI